MALNDKNKPGALGLSQKASETAEAGRKSSAKKVVRVQKTKDYCRPIPFSLPESLIKMIENKIMEVSVELAKEGIPFKTSQSKVVAEILLHGFNDKKSWEAIKAKLKEDYL